MYTKNKETTFSAQEEVVLSMLPVGVQDAKSVDLFYLRDTPAQTAATRSAGMKHLRKHHRIEEPEVEIKNNYRSYDLGCVALSPDGVTYAIDRLLYHTLPRNAYRNQLGQLRQFSVRLLSEPCPQLADRLSSEKLEKLLQMQAARAFFSVVSDPECLKIDCARVDLGARMRLLSEGVAAFCDTKAVGTLTEMIGQFCSKGKTRQPEVPEEGICYLDLVEALAYDGMNWADDFPVGALIDKHKKLTPVYITAKHGLCGDGKNFRQRREKLLTMVSAMVKGSEQNVLAVARTTIWANEVVDRQRTVFESSGKCIILCREPEEFERAVTDSHRQRKKKNRQLLSYYGDAAYLVPFPRTTAEKVQIGELLRTILTETGEETLLSVEGVERLDGCLYYQGKALRCGMTFCAEDITQCRADAEGSRQIVCWEWQAAYLRAVLPKDAAIYTVETTESGAAALSEYHGGGINDGHRRGAVAENKRTE